MQVDALLCDAVRVREQLLHILGGGVTRLYRYPFPAEMDVELAVFIALTSSEATVKHSLKIRIAGLDGQRISDIDGEFEMSPGEHSIAGEDLHMPLVVSLRKAPLPAPGSYSIAILVDNHEVRHLQFYAGAQPTAGPPAAEEPPHVR